MSDHKTHHSSHRWQLGAVLGLGGLIAAPYVLSALGTKTQIGPIMDLLHSAEPSVIGSGFAASVSNTIGHIPLIGHALATNPYVSFAATAGLSIGGMLLANYLEKRERNLPAGAIHWSKVVRYASLATSLLIALPSILTGITASLTFFAFCIGSAAFGSSILGKLSATIGAIDMNMGTSALAVSLPHLVTCGAAILPLGIRSLFSKTQEATTSTPILSMQLVSADTPIKGQSCQLAFRLVDTTTGQTLSAKDLATYHTKKLHTMVVDASLSDYHHLHPEYDEKRGLFTCSFTPQLSQPYKAWHDFIPAGAKENVHLMNELPAAHGYAMKPMIVPCQQTAVGDTRITINAPELRAGSGSMVTIEARDKAGNLLTDLEPIMGAYAHLVGFSEDGNHLIHCHPTGQEPRSEADRGTGKMQFHITPEVAGNTKFFLQIRRNGEDVTLPFGQRIQPPTKFAERVSQPGHSHAMAVG